MLCLKCHSGDSVGQKGLKLEAGWLSAVRQLVRTLRPGLERDPGRKIHRASAEVWTWGEGVGDEGGAHRRAPVPTGGPGAVPARALAMCAIKLVLAEELKISIYLITYERFRGNRSVLGFVLLIVIHFNASSNPVRCKILFLFYR